MNISGLEASAKSVRALSMDAIEKAASGHPGLPLGCAELGSYIFGEFLNHDPQDLNWVNRDRFVLSAGHGSMLLYSLMHLAGYGITIEDIKQFRQMKSNTPGHPEFGWTPGVETSTGPLGQGLGNAVGMALAGKRHAAKYNKEDFPVITSRVVVLVGDGDLMEGVSYETCSLAGHLKLNNLIAVYDSNKISIEGSTDITFTENVKARFEAQGWYVTSIDPYNFDDLKRGFDEADSARITENKPVLIIANTIIGKGSPKKQGSSSCHGAPLGKDEIEATKCELQISGDFSVEPDAYTYFTERNKVFSSNHAAWKKMFEKWSSSYPELRKNFDDAFKRHIPEEAFHHLSNFNAGDSIPTRNASQNILNEIIKDVEYVVSGSADLASSTMTIIKDKSELSPENYLGYNIQYGVREHAMGTIMNGLYLFGGIIPVAGTFLAFSTYMTPSIRMAALMRIPFVLMFSHDSIFVGEDGPTHHPVEHLTNLRIIPNVNVMRPADAEETKIAWEVALKSKHTPSIIITSRQKTPVLDYKKYNSCHDAKHGAYILKQEKDSHIDIILMATGTEVYPTLQVAEILEKENYSVRVVNFFSPFLFEKQSDEYREKVLPRKVRLRLAVEAGISTFWNKYTGFDGDTVGINKFGISGKAEDLAKYFGLTKENIYQKAKDVLTRDL